MTLTLATAVALSALWPGARATAQAPLPDFAMVAYQGEARLGGSRVNLSDLLGRGEPLVVNFWAAQCPPCRQEMPGFQRIYDELGASFLLVGVDVGPFIRLGTRDQARAFLQEYRIDYPTAHAVSIDPVRDYGVRGMPTTLFIASDGTMVAKHVGYLPEDRLREEIEDLLLADAE